MALSFQHWQDRWSEGYTVYSGKIPIGSISSATFHAGSFAKGWQWAINNVALLGIACGRAETRESLMLNRCGALIRHIDAVQEKLIDDTGYAQLIDTSG